MQIGINYTLTVQVRQGEKPNIYKHTALIDGFCIWRYTCTNYRLSELFFLLLALILRHPELALGSHRRCTWLPAQCKIVANTHKKLNSRAH